MISKLEPIRSYWLTPPASLDYDKAKLGVALAYKAAGLKEPEVVLTTHQADITYKSKDVILPVISDSLIYTGRQVLSKVGKDKLEEIMNYMKAVVYPTFEDLPKNTLWFSRYIEPHLATYEYFNSLGLIEDYSKIEGLRLVVRNTKGFRPFQDTAYLL